MLPSPAELRELCERFRQAVEKVMAIDVKRRLAAHALMLSQVAEQLERDGGLDPYVAKANAERYEYLLGQALDETTRRTVEALLAQCCSRAASHLRADPRRVQSGSRSHRSSAQPSWIMTMAKKDRSITPDTSKALIEDAKKLMAEARDMAARSAQHVVEADARLATSRKIVEQSRQLLHQSGYSGGVSTESACERDRISERLRLARSHVSLGEKHISTLQRIIAEFERDGHDSALARQVLATFERTQALHVADRDELTSKLENPTSSPVNDLSPH